MRIAHIESSMHWGGQELRIVEQTEWLNGHNHPTWIIARPGAAIVEKAQEKSLPVYQMPIRGAFNVNTLRKLRRFLDFQGIEIMDCHGSRDATYGAYIRWLTGLPVVRSRHIIDPIRSDRFNRLIWRHGNNGIIVTAKAIRDDIIKSGLNSQDKIFVAEAGVDEKRFHPQIDGAKLRHRLGIPLHHLVIANIGMIRADKGQLQFIHACRHLLAKHKNITCIQIGEAPSHSISYKKKVVEAANKYPTQGCIRFLGYKPDIENWLALADVIIIASIGTEAKTRLVSQAFLMKKNIVATNVGGLPEMIEHQKTGLLCPANNPGALAEAVEQLIDNKPFAQHLCENAYQYAQQTLTFGRMMNGMLYTYEKGIAAAQKPLNNRSIFIP
ncbi:glycosyltransferase family 4 protein [Crenothrix sp.]|uniref:glycosyltransferase family 4 protein n=1 Tax=Crenothrix sp. TaxID=3100433 RepID=UPI00374D4D02